MVKGKNDRIVDDSGNFKMQMGRILKEMANVWNSQVSNQVGWTQDLWHTKSDREEYHDLMKISSSIRGNGTDSNFLLKEKKQNIRILTR